MIPKKVENAKPRLFFIDNIRWLMIITVVLVHTAVTYSGIGGWYYIENKSVDTLSTVVLGMINTFSQAYFMGLLFFIAGYFIPGSFDRKGAGRFIKDRLFRLGLPVAIYIFIINPFIEYYLLGTLVNNTPYTLGQYYSYYLESFSFLGGTGPLWFALALLIFSIIYALLRKAGIKPFSISDDKKYPGHLKIIIVILLISALNFAVRNFQPFGTNIYNMQPCFFSQYIILFILGIMAYRKNWLSNIPRNFGIAWLKIGLGLGIVVWVLLMVFGGPLSGREYVILGGLYWQSAVYAVWEQLLCAGVSLGLIVILRDRHNTRGKLSGFLSDNAFGVYVFHPVILISISLILRGITLYPILKFLLVAFIAVGFSFIISSIIRKVPLLKKLFS